MAPEERLLRAIFGEKAADVKDTSLRVPSGTYGIVMDVKVSARKEPSRPNLTPTEIRRQKKQIEEDHKKKSTELREELTEKLSNILLGEKIPLDVVNAETGEIIIPANRKITKTLLRKLATVYDHIEIDPSPIRIKIREIIGEFEHRFSELDMERDRQLDRIESGEDVDPGIIKQVKVYIASKRKLSVGDKMAGRHGNKGVIAKVLPEENMPFLADGTPVDIVLNPLGVPSRMNVGQVLETHLGVAAKALGLKIASPVFDGVTEKEIGEMIEQAQEGRWVLLGEGRWQIAPVRRPHRRTVRSGGRGRLHLYVEAGPPRGGQDSCARRWTVLARDATAARRQGAVRRPAFRRNGSVGHGSLRRRVCVAGVAHGQERRRAGPYADLRIHRQG